MRHARIREGKRLLIDRVCFDRGWNYGNSKVRGEKLESMMPTTALGCMTLGAAAAASTRERALDLLQRKFLFILLPFLWHLRFCASTFFSVRRRHWLQRWQTNS